MTGYVVEYIEGITDEFCEESCANDGRALKTINCVMSASYFFNKFLSTSAWFSLW